jgi:D-serine deaminase-like pyridoxal phosphate-dependent protein
VAERDADRYQRLKRAIQGESLPCAVVDLDALESNAIKLNAIAQDAGKKLRLATKSVRTPDLIRKILEEGAPTVQGLMTYTATETAFLVEQGFDDLLVAYPTAQASDAEILAELTAQGKRVSVVVDSTDQLAVLAAAGRQAGVEIRVVIEVDLSWRPGGGIHLGGRRSPLHDAPEVRKVADAARDLQGVQVFGVMGYEGHIAGVTDDNPFSPMLNPIKRTLKFVFKKPVEKTRQRVAEVLDEAGHDLEVFNGGGTGSLKWASKEGALTEVTAGSGYLDSALFSYYRDLDLTPAAYFALQVVRRPAHGIVTCLGGGYVASGEMGLDRLPVPALPAGGKLIGVEGAGEVQTPILVPNDGDIAVGDPYFFRHAKAGELAEHFNEYLLIRGDKIEGRAKTYRGHGACFLG